VRFGGTAPSYTDGSVATVTSQGRKWIRGFIPSMAGITAATAAMPSAPTDLVDISITDNSNGAVVLLPAGFRYLSNVGANPA
jgi:hypothetical protein